MAVSFLNSFLSYLVVLVVIAAVGAVAITLGITLRKKKNKKRECNRQRSLLTENKGYGKIVRTEIKAFISDKMLQENTDENHPMSTPDIIKYLENQGIHAERKSIYSDMESLADFGYDVVQVQSRLGGGYYLGSREFELPELKLLVDAVQSSRFITTKNPEI